MESVEDLLNQFMSRNYRSCKGITLFVKSARRDTKQRGRTQPRPLEDSSRSLLGACIWRALIGGE